MAIKVFGVKGNRLMPQSENFTQDFVMISNPFFFASNPSTYVSLLETIENVWSLGPWIMKTSPPQFSTVVKAVLIALQGKTVENPILANYYSTTPYRIGAKQTDQAFK